MSGPQALPHPRWQLLPGRESDSGARCVGPGGSRHNQFSCWRSGAATFPAQKYKTRIITDCSRRLSCHKFHSNQPHHEVSHHCDRVGCSGKRRGRSEVQAQDGCPATPLHVLRRYPCMPGYLPLCGLRRWILQPRHLLLPLNDESSK
ncbi:uncharacterized protein LOC118411670 [Branchiostoma floridae]|uniref:Uncharacterized protein LOC118411670 n=1 Tax=Branchiostoma floridae TaxID=7739 RepID=A0A9J7MK92_BRAFL|nr:uncharacterized protein LOC118411670 [Branchiostoma floridae]